jgi:hypothetical protein
VDASCALSPFIMHVPFIPDRAGRLWTNQHCRGQVREEDSTNVSERVPAPAARRTRAVPFSTSGAPDDRISCISLAMAPMEGCV